MTLFPPTKIMAGLPAFKELIDQLTEDEAKVSEMDASYRKAWDSASSMTSEIEDSYDILESVYSDKVDIVKMKKWYSLIEDVKDRQA